MNLKIRDNTLDHVITELRNITDYVDSDTSEYLSHSRCLRLVELGVLNRHRKDPYLFELVESADFSNETFIKAVRTALMAARMTREGRLLYYQNYVNPKGLTWNPEAKTKEEQTVLELDEELVDDDNEAIDVELNALRTLLKSSIREYVITISNKQ